MTGGETRRIATARAKSRGATLARRSAAAVIAPAGLTGLYALIVRGALTLDLGVGRRVRPLGPITRTIAAPPEVVFDVIAGPYLGRTPRAMSDKLRVLERGSDMVLAAHFNQVGGLRATTVETVRFERPGRVSFRVVRGPVPHLVETYELRPAPGGTRFTYAGELGTDLWRLGEWWGRQVARTWVSTVDTALDGICGEAERRARVRSAP